MNLEEFKTYLLDKIVESKEIRDKADKELSKSKTQEAKTVFYVAGIRADERINVYNELLQKIYGEENESPYCEICGHCGEIGCCGIESFIENHIKGKTNCKNESAIIEEIKSICEYETEVFEETKKRRAMWEELYNKNLMLKTPNMKLLQLEMKELEQKYNLGSDKDVMD